MKIDKRIAVYGDTKLRSKCPKEDIEQMTIFLWLKTNHPVYFSRAVHVKQEGKKSFYTANKDAQMGLNKGWSDITIVGSPMLLCELKRADFTKGKLRESQSDFLIDAQNAGAFVGVALGNKGFIDMFEKWLLLQK
jgi:hypothetical protein